MTHTTATLIRLLFLVCLVSTLSLMVKDSLSDEWMIIWFIVWVTVFNRLITSIFKDAASINDDDYKDNYSSGVNIVSLFILLALVSRYAEIVEFNKDQASAIVMFIFFSFLVAFGAASSKLKELEHHKTDMDRMVKHHIFKK
jgi:cobalamin synthase